LFFYKNNPDVQSMATTATFSKNLLNEQPKHQN